MSVLNRIVVVMLALGLIAAAFGVLTAPDAMLRGAAVAAASLAATSIVTLQTSAAALGAFGVLLLYLELRPRRRNVFLARVEHGLVEFRPEMVAESVERDLMGVEGVRHAKVSVQSRGSKVGVVARVFADESADPTQVASRAAAQARERVQRLGLPLAGVRVSIEPAGAKRLSEEWRPAPTAPTSVPAAPGQSTWPIAAPAQAGPTAPPGKSPLAER